MLNSDPNQQKVDWLTSRLHQEISGLEKMVEGYKPVDSGPENNQLIEELEKEISRLIQDNIRLKKSGTVRITDQINPKSAKDIAKPSSRPFLRHTSSFILPKLPDKTVNKPIQSESKLVGETFKGLSLNMTQRLQDLEKMRIAFSNTKISMMSQHHSVSYLLDVLLGSQFSAVLYRSKLSQKVYGRDIPKNVI